MKIYNLKEVFNSEFIKWISDNIPELTAYQKEKIRKININQDSDFYVFKKRKKIDNIFLRFTILLFPIIWLLIVLSLPINFVINGKWGYKYESLKWFSTWGSKLSI